MAFRKSTGARPAIRVGDVFEKTSAGSLASGFSKMLLHLCSKLAPLFSALSVPIRCASTANQTNEMKSVHHAN
jgi:hypothetical protein